MMYYRELNGFYLYYFLIGVGKVNYYYYGTILNINTTEIRKYIHNMHYISI